MKRIVELQKMIESMSWPGQNNGTSIAGGSRALFLGARRPTAISRTGCVSRRTFDAQHVAVMRKVHALAKCCAKELPYVGMYITQLEPGQGLNQRPGLSQP